MAPNTPSEPVAAPPDPPQDHAATALPNNIAIILNALGILRDFGRHLLETVRHRATAPHFNAIAACFGTDNLSIILAHLNRGLLRAAALERMLLARAATGRDFLIPLRRNRTPEAQPAPADSQPEQQAAEPPTPRLPSIQCRPAGWDDPALFIPTDFDLEVRRRSIGRTVVEICLDLAVIPCFCTAPLWNELFDIIHHFNGSIASLMQQHHDREKALIQQQDRKPGGNWDWLNMSREAIRQMLGFFIGEPLVNPLEPVAAIATGPP